MIPLYGTLETVVIQGVHKEKTGTAHGTIRRNEQPIYVANGVPFLDQHILVRTDTWLNKGYNLTMQMGKFITSKLPPEMINGLWLPPEGYILTGILPWHGNWPVLDKVNDMYDPGNMGNAPYFPIADQEGTIIWSKGPYTNVKDYQEAVENRLRMDIRNSRVILVGSDAQISGLEQAIRDNDIIPVRMEPLSPKKAEPTVAVAVSLH